MSSDAQDIAVARYLKQEGMVSPAQLARALQAQAKAVESGEPMSLAAALVEEGAITPVQKDALDRRIKSEDKKGAQQLLHYKLTKKLGEGGMGAVYLAEDSRSGRKVALKVLPRKHAADPEFMKRFKREAEAAGKLNHPNIVRAYEAGEDVGYHFYAMEYCEGEPLDRILKRAGLLSWRRSFEIVRNVACGLQYAHEQGFIHRDIKPANIFLGGNGTIKILDLGLSKKIDESQLSFQTVTGAILGTPHYISPEQAQGDKSIDGRTDIYSLGAMLYHLLTGEPPFNGTTLYEILMKHVNAELPNPQDVSEDIPDGSVTVLRKMMAKAVRDRYANCGELLKDVDLVLQGKAPESAVLQAGASSVAQLRKRIEGGKRKRAGTVRVALAASPRKPRPALIWGGIAGGAAALLLLALALRSAAPTSRPPAAVEPPVSSRKSEPPRTSPIDPRSAAREKLDVLLRTLEGPPPSSKEKRVAELERFIAENPGTPAAATAKTAADDLRRMAPPTISASPVESWSTKIGLLPAEEQARRVIEKLKDLNPGLRGAVTPTIGNEGVIGLTFAGPGVKDLAPLAALKKLTLIKFGEKPLERPLPDVDLAPLRGLPLNSLDLTGMHIGDLSPLKGMPLERLIGNDFADLSPLAGLPLKVLFVNGGTYRDLSALRGMSLTQLGMSYTKVSDLSPLRGMRLEFLDLTHTPVGDLSPLTGMPLEVMNIDTTGVSDLSALRGMPLKTLWCDFVPARDGAILKSIRTLEKINNMSAAEFWRQHNLAGPGAVDAPPSFPSPVLPPLSRLWKAILENKAKLLKQSIPIQKPGLEGATFTIKEVSEAGLLLDVKIKGGGMTQVMEKPETLSEEVLADLLQRAEGPLSAERRQTLALLKVDRAFAAVMERARTRMRFTDWKGAVTTLLEARQLKPEDGEAARLLAEAEGHTGPPPTLTLDLGGGVTMEMIYIKPGVFTMGGTDAPALDWQREEKPPHRVTLTKGYYLGKVEVTRGQFAAFVKATGYRTDAEREGNAFGRRLDGNWGEIAGATWKNPVVLNQTDEHPVVFVGWTDAKAFCDWAAAKTKRGVGLPTEAQWEYAARAGTTTRWSSGEDDSRLGDYAWFGGNSGMQTHPVGQKKPNGWGLHDMGGNVWEWCRDLEGPYGGEATDPTGAAGGERRCLRGGGWFNGPAELRPAFRNSNGTWYRTSLDGFRAAIP